MVRSGTILFALAIKALMKCDLYSIFGSVASSLPVEESKSFTFSGSTFGEIPDRLETDELVITKGTMTTTHLESIFLAFLLVRRPTNIWGFLF